jgi:hypothetical protein
MTRRSTVLDVRVRLLEEPCLWCWEIVDRSRRDAVVCSGWAIEWMAYESSEAALVAGRRYLAKLLMPDGAGTPFKRRPRRASAA